MLAATAMLCTVSCDEIAENDRLIEVTPVTSERVVLVEEFSGQFCINCPDGANVLADIHDMYSHDYGMDLVVVSIHCGSNLPKPLGLHENSTKGVGLANDFGESIYASYNSPALPAVVVDRATAPNEDMNVWVTPISKAFEMPTSLSLSAEGRYNPADGNITVKLTGSSTLDLTGNVHVWLTEDAIVAPQILKSADKGGEADMEDGKADGYNMKHVFNHIFRASLTEMAGTPVSYAWDAAEPVVSEFTIKADSKWNVANMTVVAFVDNASGVCQAVKAPLLPVRE